MKETRSLDALFSLAADILFVLLPLLVHGLVSTLYQQEALTVLARSAEWSFAAAILFGQSLVRFVVGTTKLRKPVWERLSATIAAIIVLGLMPSLIVLSLILISPNPASSVVVVQLVLFVLAVATYLLMGGIGHYALSEQDGAGRNQ